MNALGVLRAVGIGMGLGAFAGMPIGVINMAIVDAVAAGRRRFAGGLGLGGAGADAIHAGLAFAGTGQLVTADRELVRALAIAAAVVIVGYAALVWRRRRARPPRPAVAGAPSVPAALDPEAGADAAVQVRRGAAAGFLLTLPNPGSLGAWVAVAAVVVPDASPAEAGVIAGGVLIGSAAWFTVLARLVGRIRPDHPVLAVVPRAVLSLLIALAIVVVVRAL